MNGEMREQNEWRRRKKRRRRRSPGGKLLGCVFLLLAAAVAVVWTPGCSRIAERVKYELSGAGVEQWENTALEEGILTGVEEYYYDHLPEELKEAYREIYVRVMRGEDSGEFLSQISVENFWTVYYAMLADHPEIFWLASSAQVEESGLTGSVVSYSLDVSVPAEARPSMQQQLEAAADACIGQIPSTASDYEKMKIVYDYIIDTTEYNGGSADSQNIQSVLLYRSSVCAGYSKAFQYILHRMGMFCTYITGRTTNGGEHGWNMVRIGDQYYYVDVTWGDPVFANEMSASGSGTVTSYNYLCCTETDLFKTHIPDDTIELPPCTSDDYNYYRLTGCYYDSFDYNTIYNALMNSVWAGDTYIVMKFGTQEAYATASYELFSNGMLSDPGNYLMEVNGVNSWNYRYNTDDNFYVITVYWY